MKANQPGNTHEVNNKLASSSTLKVEENVNEEADASQPIIDQIRMSRGENSWIEKDIEALKKGALCEIAHYHRTLKKRLKIQRDEALVTVRKNEAVLKNLSSEKEEVALEIMKGLSVSEAFVKCCGILKFDELDSDSPERLEVDAN